MQNLQVVRFCYAVKFESEISQLANPPVTAENSRDVSGSFIILRLALSGPPFSNSEASQIIRMEIHKYRLLPSQLVLLAAVVFVSGGAARALPALPIINTNNVVNIASFGAVGDGVTTNTVAIQNAINAAAAGGTTNNAGGGTVEFPSGIFLSGPLTLKSSVNLQLDNGAILRMLK